jgi:hypothetical protein
MYDVSHFGHQHVFEQVGVAKYSVLQSLHVYGVQPHRFFFSNITAYSHNCVQKKQINILIAAEIFFTTAPFRTP